MSRSIDLNCDLGELDGPEGLAHDLRLLQFISSANIACGGHAGDAERIARLIELCINMNIAIGAHPSYVDRANFGRTPQSLSRSAIADLVAEQCRLVQQLALQQGERLHHVKPHGALYNQAAIDPDVAAGIVDGVLRLGQPCFLVGLAGSLLIQAAKNQQVPYLQEFFADRQYTKTGQLVERGVPDAVLTHVEQIEERVLQLLETGSVRAMTGERLQLQVDTICVHGDTPGAEIIALELAASLARAGFNVEARSM